MCGKKVLVIKPSSLGDIVHGLPFLAALKRSFPETEVHWVVAKGFEGILEGHPLIRKVWIVRKDQWKKISKLGSSLAELRGLFRDFRAEKFDCAVDLQGLFRSGFIAKASGAPMRIGFHEAREGSRFFYTHTVKGGRDVHAVDRCLRIAAFLGCDTSRAEFPFVPLRGEADRIRSEFGLRCGGYAVMAPGARGPTKRWPPQRFGGLASVLPMPTVVVGSKGDAPLARSVVDASHGAAVSIAGTTDLRELSDVIRCARFMVSNDTGPMHIAAALGVPVFALFGPTNPERTGPYGLMHTVIRKDLPCSPCYRRTCKTAACIDEIGVEEVAGAIQEREATRGV